MVRLRYESGRENKGSALLSGANLNQARYDLIVAENTRRSAKAALAAVLALDLPEADPEAVEFVGNVPTQPPGTVPSFLDLLPTVPEHLRAVASQEAAEFNTVVARGAFFPIVDLTASIGRNSLLDFSPDTRAWSLGFRITVPLFNGLSNFGSLRNAASNQRAATFSRFSIDRGQITQLVQTYNRYVEATTKLKVDQSFRDAALVRADIGRRKYNNGLLSFEDWDVIENDLINRQRTYLQSKRDRVVAEAAWERAQGRSVFP